MALMSSDSLKTIWFEKEMLPRWAQLLDVAARLTPVSQQTRSWFARFTNSAGVADARIIITNVRDLQTALQDNKPNIIAELQRAHGDEQGNQVYAAWQYALDTMLQVSASKKTCSWKVEDLGDSGDSDFGDGDITLRRV